MTGAPSEAQMKLLRWKLVDAFKPRPNANEMAGRLIKVVFNADRSADLDRAMASTLLDWLILGKDEETNKIIDNPKASAEAKAMVELG